MNDKKLVFILGFLSFFLIAFIFGMLMIVSAAPYYPNYGNYGGGFNIRQGSQQLIDFFVGWGEPFLQALLGGYDYTGMLLFEKFLIFLLILSVVYLSLNKVDLFSEQKKILWVISIIIPILAVRYMNFAWLNTILMQYQILGIAIAGILPFIVYLFFLHNALADYPAARKIGWIFFIVVYFGLWTTSEAESYGSVYFWTMLIAVIFLFGDGTIHRYIMRQRWAGADREQIVAALAELAKEIDKYQKPITGLPEPERKRMLRMLYKRRKEYQKQL